MRTREIGTGLRRGGLVALAITTTILAGCGGGGGGGKSAATPATGSSGSSGGGVATPGANSAPTITASPANHATVGSAYNLAPQATDADGDTLAFSIENRPAWAQFNTATGRLSGTPTATGTSSNIVISVSDGTTSTALPAFAITVAAAGSAPPPATGNSVVLSWEVPTRTTTGDTLADLAGYRIHYGPSATTMVYSIEVPSAGLNRYTVSNLPAGTYYFAVRAVTSNGTESPLSNVITRPVS